MADPSNLCCPAAIFLAGMIAMANGINSYLLTQKIKNLPTSKTHSAAIGLAEFSGTALGDEEIYSPIHKVKCAYWAIDAYYYRRGKHGGWKPIYKSKSDSTFYLKDETGKILVDSKDAQMEIPIDKTFIGYIEGKGMFGVPHTQMDDLVLKFIETLSPSDKSKIMGYKNQEVKVCETYIAEGDPLYVLGSVEMATGATSSIGSENLIVKKGKHDGTFYISDKTEKDVLANKSGGSVMVSLAIGLGMAAIGVLLLAYMIMDLGTLMKLS